MYYNLKESGLRIQKLRKQSGMTQEQLAAKMNTSISNLGKLERGLQGLSIDLLINLALFFHVSLDYIILGKELQVDTIKTALRSMVDTLMNLEQKTVNPQYHGVQPTVLRHKKQMQTTL